MPLKGFQNTQLKAIASILILVKLILGCFSIWSEEFLWLNKVSIKIIPYSFLNSIYSLWFKLPVPHLSAANWLSGSQFSPTLDLYVLVFMLKLPFLIADVLCGYLIYKIVNHIDKERSMIALLIWLANPYVTLITEMMGAVDIFPILFMLISIFFFLKEKNILSILFITIAISLKLYPILIVPIFLIFLTKFSIKKHIIYAFLFIVSSILGVIIYYYWIVSKLDMDFLSSLAFYTPLTFLPSEYMILFKSSHRVGLSVTLGLVSLFLIYKYWMPKRREEIVDASLSFFLIYFAFLNWAPQYLLLLIPLMSINVSFDKLKFRYFLSILLMAFIITLITLNEAFAYHNSIFFIQSEKFSEYFSEVMKNIKYDLGIKIVIEPIARALFMIICVFYSIKLFLNKLLK